MMMRRSKGMTLGVLTVLVIGVLVALWVAFGGGRDGAPTETAAAGAATTTAPPEAAPTDAPAAAPPDAPTATAAPTLEPTATLAPTAEPTAEPEPPARSAAEGEIYVDASAAQGTLNPLARGLTWGPLWPLSLDMTPLIEDLRLGVISFPGGEYGDTTDLQTIAIDRFIEFSRQLEGEPLIHVRLPNSTPEKAVAMLNYTNKEKGYGVKYWAIGNEPNLYAPKYTDVPWDAAYFAAEWRRFALAMKEADPSILLVGPEVTQFAGVTGITRSDELAAIEWMRTFLEVNGDLVDIVSIHRYPFPVDNFTETTAAMLLANPPEWDEKIIPDLRALMVETVGRELPIAVTEINSHWNRAQRQEASPDTLVNAIWWGDVFMRMARAGVDLVAYWSMTSRDDQGTWGIVGKYGSRPTYYTFALYSRFGDDLVYAEAAGSDAAGPESATSALAAWRDDGALTVMLSNRGDESETFTLVVENLPAAAAGAQVAEVWRLDAEHKGTAVEGDLPQLGGEITLPPRSLTLLVLR